MSEFEEIAHTGGKIELIWHPEKEAVSLRWSHGGGHKAVLFQLGVALDGSRVEYWPFGGMDLRQPQPKPPMVPVIISSDQEGYFGRTCPDCKSYFRTDDPAQIIHCPYCATRQGNVAFTTENQKLFVEKVLSMWREAFGQRRNVVLDMDQLITELPANRPVWAYSEQKQQTSHHCSCGTGYDILGDYGCCPTCGKRNSLQVFIGLLLKAETDFDLANANLKDRHEREVEWEKLTRLVSDFEAMARDIQSQLIRLPLTPRRRKQLQTLSFQNLLTANERLETWVGFDFMDRMDQEDKQFLNRMFHRRHILTHNAGRVDEEYLQKSGDTTLRLNERVRVRSNEIKRLFPLLKTCAENLFQAYESIAPL